MMIERPDEPVAAADGAFGETGVGSGASAPEASELAADRAEQDLRIQLARIRADAAAAIKPGPAAT